MSARHFGSKPGYLNTVTYIAPSSEVSTFLVTAYRYNNRHRHAVLDYIPP